MSDQQILAAGMGNYKQSFSLADIELETAIYQHPLYNQYFPESSGNFHHDNSTLQQRFDVQHSQSKRKAEATISDLSPDQNCVGRGKKVRRQEKKEAKSAAEVVHVRARRGQATDSHSLAERVRRERINERLRCLQDIVPGCYKTMGMAVMLDEIINYVQSLQNQVQFLSMKLTAATTFYDVSSHADASGTMQIAKAFEASETQNGLFSHGVPSAQLAPLLPSTFHTTNAKI